MAALRTALVGATVGLGLVLGSLAPAQALASTAPDFVHSGARDAATRSPAASDVLTTNVVAGASWSAPAYPVDCRSAEGQISCTPTDPASVTSQQCFIGVLFEGKSTTVCTTFEGHVGAIQSAGGTPLFVKYGCALVDPVCTTFENAGRGMAVGATAMMYLVAENMRFDTSTLLWTATIGEWSFWQWAILIITFGAMVWAIAAAVVAGDRADLVAALVRSFLAIPAVPTTLWMTGHLLNAIDDMTWYVMSRGGPVALFSTLQSVMWAGGQANYFFAFLIDGLLLLGMLLLMLVFTFLNIVLAALISVGPVAWMLFPVRGIGPQWVIRYVSAVVALLLAGPLTIGFVTLIINGLARVKTIWDPQSWPLLVGLVLVAFAPFAIFGLFSFVGAAAADGVGSRLGSHGGRMAGSAALSASRIPTRLGGRPSGIRPGGSGLAIGGRSGGAGAVGTRSGAFRQAAASSKSTSHSTSPASSKTSAPSRPPAPRTVTASTSRPTAAMPQSPHRTSSPSPAATAPNEKRPS